LSTVRVGAPKRNSLIFGRPYTSWNHEIPVVRASLLKQDCASVSLVLLDLDRDAVASERPADAGAGISAEKSPDLVLQNNHEVDAGCLLQEGHRVRDHARRLPSAIPADDGSVQQLLGCPAVRYQ
jgi:hypothetical protein